jgi:hypothetical protein
MKFFLRNYKWNHGMDLAQSMSSLQMTPEWIDKTSNKNRVVGLIMMQANHAMSTTVNSAP